MMIRRRLKLLQGAGRQSPFDFLSCSLDPTTSLAPAGGTGDWNTVSNWSSGTLPGVDDNVVIDQPGASLTVTHSSGAHIVKSVLCHQSFVISGGSLAVSNTVQVNRTFTLSGGTLMAATVLPGTNAQAVSVLNCTLNSVTMNANMDLIGNYSYCAVNNGLVLNGTARLGTATNNSYGLLSFVGTQTLSGNGTILFGLGYDSNYNNTLRLENAGTVLTIGPSIIIRGQNGNIEAFAVHAFDLGISIKEFGVDR
jgi:hypothetical protein